MLRSFPRTNRRRWAAALVVSGVLMSALSGPVAHAADRDKDPKDKKNHAADRDKGKDLKDKKSDVKKHIEHAEDELTHSSKEYQAAQAALAQSQVDLARAQVYLAKTQAELQAAIVLDRQMQAKLDAAEARLAQARSDLEKGQAEVADQDLLLKQIVVSHYQAGDPGLVGLSSVLTTQNPSELTGQLKSAQAVLDKESVILDRLEATKVILTVRQREVNAAKIEVAKQRKAAAENLARKQSLEQQAEQAKDQVAQMVSLRALARDVALRAKKADLRELDRLKVEEKRIEALILAQASKGSGYTGPVTGNGFLDWPVPGPVTSPFGWRTHPIYGYRALHNGLDIGAGCGTPIRAPRGGTVLTQYYQSAWGNRVIVDHGVKYGVGVATTFNHLSAFAVSIGEHVKRGQVIGFVGTTGWSTGCHLHFSVLENGVAVDPLKWL